MNIEETASAKDRNSVKDIKQEIRLTGFNSIFAAASIDASKAYYSEFKRQMKEHPEKALKRNMVI